jgi:LPXTG-motif cell wall-anchored protein
VEVIPKKQEPKGTNDTPVVVETKRSETETSVTVKKGNLPRTGQLWWPVILLAAGGILFVVWGLIIKRKRK